MKQLKRPPIDDVTEKQWKEFSRLITQPGKLMPHEVVSASGLERPTVVALFTALAEAGCGELLLLIYAQRAGEQPVGARRVKDGFPRLPYYVDAIDDCVERPDELTYDFLLKLDDGVSLER